MNEVQNGCTRSRIRIVLLHNGKSYIFFNYEADSTYKLMTIVHYFESDAPLRYTHIQPLICTLVSENQKSGTKPENNKVSQNLKIF